MYTHLILPLVPHLFHKAQEARTLLKFRLHADKGVSGGVGMMGLEKERV